MNPEAAGAPREMDAPHLHRDAIVVDGHNDLPWRIRDRFEGDLDAFGFGRRHEDGHTDLPRLLDGGVSVQCWAAYVPVWFAGPQAPIVALEQIDLIRRLTERHPQQLEMAYSADDARRVVGAGRIASMIGVEGGHAIDGSLEALRRLYEAGARYLTLAHNRTLDWVDAAGDEKIHGGLTEFGRDVVHEMNRLGMLVDLSHVTADAMRDALETTRAPVIFSHSSARALADHPRNVPDDVLGRVGENGGIVMVNFFPGFLTPEGAAMTRHMVRDERRAREENPNPENLRAAMERWLEEHPVPPARAADVVDHIEHVARAAGVEHVGFGSDFDGIPTVPEGVEDVSRFPAITAELMRRGFSERDVRKVLGENFLRVLAEAERIAADAREEGRPARSGPAAAACEASE